MTKRKKAAQSVERTPLELPESHVNWPLGLGSTQFGFPPAIPDPRFDIPPPWFKRCAIAGRKLLALPLAREQCEANLKSGAGHYFGKLKLLPLLPHVDERPQEDWYVILFSAHDLCFPRTPLGDKMTTRGLKFLLVKYAQTHPAELEQVLLDSLDHVRRDLQESGVENSPSDDGANEFVDANAKTSSVRSDTRSDTPKKTRKKLLMNAHAVQCAARFNRQKKLDPTTTMCQIVEEYARENKGVRGDSASYINRILNDNPSQLRKGK